MNTSKQINAMLGLLLLTVVVLGGYWVNEGNRQSEAREEQTERVAERGARIFVQNCRTCHGLDGEGFIGTALNNPAFLILGEENEFGVEATAAGEADGIRTFLRDTISCGRTGTFMPPWSLDFGGPLSDQRIGQLVVMITEMRWDLVEELAAEIDEETGATAEDILVDPSTLSSPTQSNCGQYSGEGRSAIVSRTDPRLGAAATPVATATDTTGTPPPPPDGGEETAVSLAEFSVTPATDQTEAGSVTFRVANDGATDHEFVVVRSDAAPNALPRAGGLADETQFEVVGRIDAFAGGQTKDTTLDLAAGSYLLICNLPGHYQLGMTAAFTIR